MTSRPRRPRPPGFVRFGDQGATLGGTGRRARNLESRVFAIMIGVTACELFGLLAMLWDARPAFVVSLFFTRAPAAGWWACAAVAVSYVCASMRGLPIIREQFLTLNGLKLTAVVFGLSAAATEELFFRRVLMNWANHAGWGLTLQVGLSAIAFGAAHAVWGAFSRDVRAVVRPVAFTTLLGALLAAVYLLAGRHLAPCFWSHAAINLALEPWLLLGVLQRHGQTGSAPVAR